jgi:fatty-acyl-CoA synthase
LGRTFSAGLSSSRDGRGLELVLRSLWLTQGYGDNPAASKTLWTGEYLHTGDIAVITPDGYIRVSDRIKESSRAAEKPA